MLITTRSAKNHADWPNNQDYKKKIKSEYIIEKVQFKTECLIFFLHILGAEKGRNKTIWGK